MLPRVVFYIEGVSSYSIRKITATLLPTKAEKLKAGYI
jgi:hypothetical protein